MEMILSPHDWWSHIFGHSVLGVEIPLISSHLKFKEWTNRCGGTSVIHGGPTSDVDE